MPFRSTRALATAISTLAAAALAPRVARADAAEDVARVEEEFVRAHGDPPVAAFRVEGLHRTRPGVVNQWLKCKVGEPLSRCNLATIRDRVYRLAIFSKVDVALEEGAGGAVVVFQIEEKWTIYPVPVLWYSPGTEIAGLILGEANLLGYNKGLAAGGVYSNRGWYTLAAYSDPNIAFSDFWGLVHAFLGSGIVDDELPDGTILQSYDMTRFDLEYSLGWTLWDRVSPAWTGGCRIARVGAVHVAGTEPAVNATVAMQGFQLTYSDLRYRDLYDAGLRASAEIQHAFPLDGVTPSYTDAIFDFKWARAAPLRGFIDLRARAFLGSLPVVLEERLGGLDGSRTLPGSGLVAADRYVSAWVDYQVPVFSPSLGTATVGPWGEVGRYESDEGPAVTYGGPGLGFRFFLRRVAIPVVGVDAGYEVGSGTVRFSVSVGYRPLR
jgi:hypothetical protein